MNVYKFIKWLLIFALAVISVIYLGRLLMMLLSAYILYSMLHPLKIYFQTKLKIKPHTLSSLSALLFPALLISMLVIYIFPVIITQLHSLSYLSYKDVFENILNQFPFFEKIIDHLGGKKYVIKNIEDTMTHIINLNIIAQWSSILFSNFSQIILNLLITFFITFHLLKDEFFLSNLLDKLSDDHYEKDIEQITQHIKIVLGKYFRGLLIDVCIVMTANSIVLSILNVPNAILIGILSGVLNIIPYVGPLITLFIGLFLGVSSNILDGHYELISGTVIKILITITAVNILDGIILQPYIFSNVLKAHPLEIFLVIIGAGMLGGVVWMMMIIPIYVISKVAIKEIYTYWKSKYNV